MSGREVLETDHLQSDTLERLIRQIVQEELQILSGQPTHALPALHEAREIIYRTNAGTGQTYFAVASGQEEVMENEKVSIQTQSLGRWIVADPRVCHGKPTFRSTRIMVWQVLEMVASGMAWETIVEQWDGKVTRDAIAEAVNLANRSFLLHAHEHALEMAAA
jgi:uncharacterized protein (DUF433 family)